MPRKPDSVPLDSFGFPGYLAVKSGGVLSLKSQIPKLLATAPNSKSGRPMVQMSRAGKPAGRPLARLILEAFTGRRSKQWEPLHRNGDVNDCRLANLRWKKKDAPDRERAIKLIRGLMRKYKIDPDDLRGSERNIP